MERSLTFAYFPTPERTGLFKRLALGFAAFIMKGFKLGFHIIATVATKSFFCEWSDGRGS